jgi:hypothetical protein
MHSPLMSLQYVQEGSCPGRYSSRGAKDRPDSRNRSLCRAADTAFNIRVAESGTVASGGTEMLECRFRSTAHDLRLREAVLVKMHEKKRL